VDTHRQAQRREDAAATDGPDRTPGSVAPDGAAIRGIGQIAIRVHDVPRAVGFYRDVLGLRYLFEAGGMAFFECGGIRLMLSKPESAEFDHPGSILYYSVADIASAHARAAGAGASFEALPHKVAELGASELWMAFFRDPDGNMAALMSEKPKPARREAAGA